MKAAVLNAFGSPLAIETVPEPAAWHRRGHRRRRGEPRAGLRQRGAQRGTKIPSGTARRARPRRDRPHPRHRPRCDPASSRRLGLLRSDRALTRQCAVARHRACRASPAAARAACACNAYFHDGAWAEQMRLPTENAIPIGDIDAKDAGRWCALGTLLVPYGGFLAANLQAGEIALVNGATGSFRQRRRRRRAGNGRAVRRRDRAERAGADRADAAVRRPRPDRADARPRG